MKKMGIMLPWAAVSAALAVSAAAGGAAGAPVGELTGAGIGTVLACLGCASLGLEALISGVSLTVLLWSQGVFAATSACLGVCAAALAY